MMGNYRRNKYPRQSERHIVPDWMGYPRSDFSRYDPNHEDRGYGDRKNVHALEGAGRKGWDYDQNRAYSSVYGDTPGRPWREDEMYNRNHRGKGPRGYRRSDERIMEDIIDRLNADRALDLSEIEIEVRDGDIYLSGNGRDRITRHRIEDIVNNVPGVKNIENAIRSRTRS
jgi:hypothetical protein